ncbi:hypothetical protein [Aurantiacibacter gilvus]|uniref:Ribbon-helix-helix protein CopG domain-containing protein n=1 Tax=Aurantiacibacter gilvus TaxID=3139141 RepID=A0ABU9IAE7_9SPHN
MTESNAFASLGPMLLARKGTAKPAMRTQLTQNDRVATLGDDFDELAASQTALGWDDMGHDDQVVRLPVSNARKRMEQQKQARRKAVDQGRRAAFTLRLDAERHLKLRLASTIQECSAQELVTAALDQYLAEISELDSIAAHVAGKKSKA